MGMPESKVIVVALTSTGFSIAHPEGEILCLCFVFSLFSRRCGHAGHRWF